MEFDPGHPCEQIDIDGANRTSAEPHVDRGQVERLQQNADILQDKRIGDRSCTSTKSGRKRAVMISRIRGGAGTSIASWTPARSAVNS